MQLALDATDRLVELLEERAAPVDVVGAARFLFAARSVPDGLASSLIQDVVAGDARLRLVGASLSLADAAPDAPLESAEFVVFDLETTGLSASTSRICEIGAIRVRALELVDEFETLVDPRLPLPPTIGRLTGLDDRQLRGAPRVATAVRRFIVFAGSATLVAHNARFDLGFLDRQLDVLHGRKRAAAALDTVALARRLLAGRVSRTSLASLSHFFGTAARPCHRALPDAHATAEVLLQLIGLAQERGARSLADLHALAAPRKRRVYGKRVLAHGAPTRPGVYLFRDRDDRVLYVGKARDLRARLRSYFRSERQRPAVEAALGAAEAIEWRVVGSELEAALEELRLIRELRPPANTRNSRPDRYVYLRRRGEKLVVGSKPTLLGPLGSRRQAQLAARALELASTDELEALPRADSLLARLRAKLRDLSELLRYEEAARLRDRIGALERVLERLQALEWLRSREVCLLAPACEEGWLRGFFVAGGRVCAVRSLPPGPGARLEIEAALAAVQAGKGDRPCIAPEVADELFVVKTFLRRPPPELRVVRLDAHAILAACSRLPGPRSLMSV